VVNCNDSCSCETPRIACSTFCNFQYNCDPANGNGFHYLILVFYAETVNSPHQLKSPLTLDPEKITAVVGLLIV